MSDTEEVKYCEDCVHFNSGGSIGKYKYARCSRREGGDSLVSRNHSAGTRDWHCSTSRTHDHLCGPEGKWFLPKPPKKSFLEWLGICGPQRSLIP